MKKIKSILTGNPAGQAVWNKARAVKKVLMDASWLMQGMMLPNHARGTLAAAPPPVFICGTGGSGTRVAARIVEAGGVFMGKFRNPAMDGKFTEQFLRRWIETYLKETRASPAILPASRLRVMDRSLELSLIKHRRFIPRWDSPWGVKNPRFIYFLPYLYRRFPKMKLLHIIRDGRDMAFSRNQTLLMLIGETFLAEEDQLIFSAPPAVRSMLLWAKTNMEAARFAEVNLKERYLRVRFEDLCRTPEQVVRLTLDFVGAPMPDIGAALAEIKYPSTIGRWRSQDPKLVAEVLTAGEEALKTFGYLDEYERLTHNPADEATAPDVPRSFVSPPPPDSPSIGRS